MTGERGSLAEALHTLLAELIAIPSTTPPGDTQAICAAAATHLEAAGCAVSMPMRTPPIANLVATLGAGAPSLVVQRAHRHGRRRRPRGLAQRPLRRDHGRRPHPRARRQQLQGLGGGASLARRRGGAARRAGAGKPDLRARRRRRAPRPRGHRLPARGRADRAGRPGARRAPRRTSSSSRSAASCGWRSRPPAGPPTAATRRPATTPSCA